MKQWYNGYLKPCIICGRIIDYEPHEAIGKNNKHMHYAHSIYIKETQKTRHIIK